MAEILPPPETSLTDSRAAPPETLYRAAMLRRFGLLYRLSGLGLIMGRLRMIERSAENIRRAAEQGPLVYVMYAESVLDWLALNRVLNAHRLPLARYTNGVSSVWWAPLKDAVKGAWAALKARLNRTAPPDPVASGWLADAVARGVPTALFLVQPRDLVDFLKDPAPGPLPALFDAQRKTDRPIQIVPVVVVWSRSPQSVRGQIGRFILGAQDEPGPFQKLWTVMTRTSTAIVQAGEPVDLQEVLQQLDAQGSHSNPTRAVRLLLRRYLYRESHVIRGPGIRPYQVTRRNVLNSQEIRRLVTVEAQATGRTEDQIRAEISRTLDHVAARLSYPVIRTADFLVRQLLDRIYSGVDVREEDLERVRAAMRAGTVVLVPCHRSHLDYMLVSSVLFNHDIAIPHVVGGENLSFWPLGPFARRVGTVFIRRSFKGDRVFPVVFERYLRQLIRDRFPIEFFIEGTRSRSGKLLPPKLGVLGMVVGAAAGGREDQEVTLLPVAISYEQIAEEKAYAAELAGGKKKPEDIGQVVRARRVLRNRFGKVYLRVGEPLPVRKELAAQGAPWEELDREHRRELLQNLGERVIYRISREIVVLPTGLVALALLAQSRRGLYHQELLGRVHRLLELLRQEGASTSATLSAGGWVVAEALRRFEADKSVIRLQDESGEILQVVDEKRLTLEYYKNGLLPPLAPASLLASSVRAVCLLPPQGEGGPRPDAGLSPTDPEVSRLFRSQVYLLRYEFILDPEAAVDDIERRAVDSLVRYGALKQDAETGALSVGDPSRLAELAGLTRNLLESYILVLRAAIVLRSRDLEADDLPRRIQEIGRGLLAVDELRRPEALSVENLKNAVRAFREEDVLQIRSGGGGLQFDERAHGQYLADLRRLLS